MHLLVVGFSPRDEATFGFFLGRFKKGWTWQGVPAETKALPQADIVMLDLAALGMAHWSPESQDELLKRINGRPAVLVVSANDRTWTVLETEAKAHKFPLILLPRPYGTEAMRTALEQAHAWVALQAKIAPAVAPAPVAPAASPVVTPPAVTLSASAAAAALPPVGGGTSAFMATGTFLSTGAFRPVVTTVAPAAPAASAAMHHVRVTDAGSVEGNDEPSLSLAQLVMRLGRVPDANRFLFLRQLAELIGQGLPFEARFTVQNSLIIHPGEGWAASNTPMMVIERVCKSDAMASAIGLRDIDPAQAAERVHRLSMPLRELEALLWELARAANLPE